MAISDETRQILDGVIAVLQDRLRKMRAFHSNDPVHMQQRTGRVVAYLDAVRVLEEWRDLEPTFPLVEADPDGVRMVSERAAALYDDLLRGGMSQEQRREYISHLSAHDPTRLALADEAERHGGAGGDGV